LYVLAAKTNWHCKLALQSSTPPTLPFIPHCLTKNLSQPKKREPPFLPRISYALYGQADHDYHIRQSFD
jgi:hypothetical protein